MLEIILACVVTAIVTKFFERRRRFFSQALKIPSPFKISVLGEIFWILRYRFNIIKAFHLLTSKNGPIFRIWGRVLFVFVNTPELIETVFTTPKIQYRGPVVDGLVELIGDDSLFCTRAEKVKTIKKGFLKSFNVQTSTYYIESFAIETNDLLESLKKVTDGSYHEMLEVIERATTNSIARSALEADLNDCPRLLKEISNLKHFLLLAARRGYSPFHQVNILFNYLFGGNKIKMFREDNHSFIYQCLEANKKTFQGMIKNDAEIPNKFSFNLLKERPDASTFTLVQDSLTAVIGAADTSATAIGFTLTVLGMHPDIQQKVFEEDQRVMEELNGKKMEDRDFVKYEYLTRVIKETLRLYPPVPLNPRWVEDEIKLGGYCIPKRTCVVAGTIMVHRDSNYYPDPLKFDPDRFLPENVEKRSKYAYAPFGAGARSCPGYRYALHASIYMVAAIVRNFKIYSKYKSLAEMDENLDASITLFDKKHYQMRLEKR